MKVFLFWLKGIITYIIMICVVLIIFPNYRDFAIFLTNYVTPLIYVGLGIALRTSLDYYIKMKEEEKEDKTE